MTLLSIDQDSFGGLVEPFRRELQAHCYRMMGSVQDAEDMVQETLIRAWTRRETYAGRASVRAWLYRIATNVCLDALDKRPRRAVPVTWQAVSTLDEPIPASIMEPIWLEPYPDELLEPAGSTPEGMVAIQEHITLAFVTALHLLPPRQRAVLILRDVLEFSAEEAADALGMTIPAVKSALHRARTALATRDEFDARADAQPLASAQLEDYVRAWEQADVATLMGLLKEDATFSMPPIPSWYRGRETIGQLTGRTIFAGNAAGRWRLLPTRANRQLAFGLYRVGDAPGTHQGYGIQVVTVRDGQIADISTFRDPALIPIFGLPAVITI